jgi:hypothetical protein
MVGIRLLVDQYLLQNRRFGVRKDPGTRGHLGMVQIAEAEVEDEQDHHMKMTNFVQLERQLDYLIETAHLPLLQAVCHCRHEHRHDQTRGVFHEVFHEVVHEV